METRTKLLIVTVSIASAFAAGRYSVPQKIKIETKIVEIEKKSESTDVATNKKKRKKTTVVETVKPDGEKTTTTEITDDVAYNTDSSTKNVETGSKETNKTDEKISSPDKVSVLALGGVDIFSGKITYGASLSKPFAGPMTFGLFGFNDGRMGFSLGLTF